MLYKYRKGRKSERFNREIGGVLGTAPVQLGSRQLTLVSMVSNRDVPMYLLAIKSVMPELQPHRVIAIIDRDMPGELRQTLQSHIKGIEFAILEDIETAPCQHGGTWERLLFCIDTSADEYVIQIDADCLFVGSNMEEVLACVEANRAFTMADGQHLVDFPRAAELAQRTPSSYMGILSERAFSRFPEAKRFLYVRGSSGFTGFARGGITRAEVNHFHVEMEKLVGMELWKKWGSEQCGSNFAVANSPNPVVLPHPEYTSFPPHGPRWMCKFYHFIGASRFKEGYYVAKCNELIAEWKGSGKAGKVKERPWPPSNDRPAAFLRSLTPGSAARYLQRQLSGGGAPIVVQQRHVSVHESAETPGPKFELRPRNGGFGDEQAADGVFLRNAYFPPGWIPPETVETVVDLGADVGMSCLFWLANFPDCRVTAFEADPKRADQCMRNVRLNNWVDRFTLHRTMAGPDDTSGSGAAVDLFREFEGRRIDILKVALTDAASSLLADRRFAALDVGAVALAPASGDAGGVREMAVRRLKDLGYWIIDSAGLGVVWAYPRADVSALIRSRESSCSVSAAQ